MWPTRSAPQSFSACYGSTMCCCVIAFSIARVSVAEMTFSLAHVLNVAFVALYPAYKRDWKKPEQVMGCRICTSLFVGREM